MSEDALFAKAVAAGDPIACRRFVDEYTDLVLSRVWSLMKGYCHYPARERACCLVILQRQRKGYEGIPPSGQCDECMDSYIWFVELLKRKVKSYRGINECSLKTFVWAVINSHTTFVDWLRWRYGRAY